MAFKTGKQNVVSQQKEKIKQLEQEIDDLRFRPQLQKFADELGQSVLTLLSQTPYNKWPDVARIAFEWHERRSPVSAYYYKERLPK